MAVAVAQLSLRFGHGRITISPVDDKDSSSPGAAWDSKIFPTEAAEAEEEP